jgi:hypothetical protein
MDIRQHLIPVRSVKRMLISVAVVAVFATAQPMWTQRPKHPLMD